MMNNTFMDICPNRMDPMSNNCVVEGIDKTVIMKYD